MGLLKASSSSKKAMRAEWTTKEAVKQPTVARAAGEGIMVVKSKQRKENRTERGQSLVETALVLPVLVLLLAIVVDVSRTFDALMVLANAVRQGARYAALEPSPPVDDIRQMVVDDVVGSGTNVTNMSDFALGNVTVDIDPTVAVTVTAEYDFPLWFGGILGLPTFSLQKSAVIRHTEQPASP